VCGVKEIINLKFHQRTPKRHIESSLSPKLRALYQKQMRKTHDNISDTFAVCNAIVNCVRRQPKSDAMRIARSIDGISYLNVPLHMRSASSLASRRFSSRPHQNPIPNPIPRPEKNPHSQPRKQGKHFLLPNMSFNRIELGPNGLCRYDKSRHTWREKHFPYLDLQ